MTFLFPIKKKVIEHSKPPWHIEPFHYKHFKLHNQFRLRKILAIGKKDYVKKFLSNIKKEGFIPPNFIFTANKENKVIGFVRYQITEDEKLHIYSIAVDYTKAEKGVSDALVQKCIETAKNANLSQIFAIIQANNFFSLGLFKRNGFEIEFLNPYEWIATLNL
ncbi:MAG: GNAT family N-acetyltransferase [Candidatus Micrarchaeia archaeon]|jgi:ribosomal protein S18 acetylase RimI-like enzyme